MAQKVNYTVKERLERLDSKIEAVDCKVNNLQMNDVRHINIDLAELKGELKYIKWFVLATLGLLIAQLVSKVFI